MACVISSKDDYLLERLYDLNQCLIRYEEQVDVSSKILKEM